ncbi:hypothetical protein MACJ_000600 [Theileria orientalis]|uniref:ACB domain-containing protein n=1 Tax=Theileria orientalis TaxID=68886 RepID=A0A976M4B4_THEOR|nr:hypothetical protein MACJ_000600 [Theileria orientalis]
MALYSLRSCICDTFDSFLLYLQFGSVPLKEFNDCCVKVSASRNQGALTDEEFLSFYGLFKQAKFGDCKNENEMLFSEEQILKRESWLNMKGLSRKDAMIKYINLAEKLLGNQNGEMETNSSIHTKGFMVESTENFEHDDFFDLVVEGECDRVVQYLSRNRNLVVVRSPEGLTALHLAADRGNVDMVKCLIEHGANVNSVDDNGDTPLHVAIESQEDEVVKYLVEAGADPKLK